MPDETDLAVLDWRQQQLEQAGYGFTQAPYSWRHAPTLIYTKPPSS